MFKNCKLRPSGGTGIEYGPAIPVQFVKEYKIISLLAKGRNGKIRVKIT